MINMLQNWKGKVEINGVMYDSIQDTNVNNLVNSTINIKLHPPIKPTVKTNGNGVTNTDTQEFRITVKKYMTQKSSPDFDFMSKWNNDNPMPYRTMTGIKIKETRGMVYMKLHGDIWTEKISVCMCCGKTLTNPVSQYFGIGPECGQHGYTNPFESETELKAAVKSMKKQLNNVTWEGWIIKSAITEEVEV